MKSIRVMSQRAAEDFLRDYKPEGHTLVVSITDILAPPADIHVRHPLMRLLELKFDDSVATVGRMTAHQALSIWNILLRQPCDDIIVHCREGLSRSAAIGCILSWMSRTPITFSEDIHAVSPNKWVLHLMFAVFNAVRQSKGLWTPPEMPGTTPYAYLWKPQELRDMWDARRPMDEHFWVYAVNPSYVPSGTDTDCPWRHIKSGPVLLLTPPGDAPGMLRIMDDLPERGPAAPTDGYIVPFDAVGAGADKLALWYMGRKNFLTSQFDYWGMSSEGYAGFSQTYG